MAPCRTVWALLCTGFLSSQPATPVPCGHDVRRGVPAPAGARGVSGCDAAGHRAGFHLALRGGSSAWNTALMQASSKDVHGRLSLDEACAALKPHGLAVNPVQMQDFLGLCGSSDLGHVSESHFSAALAVHPPSSVLGRWQQKARFQAACSHTMSSLPSEIMMPPSNTKGAGIEDLQIEAAEVARTEAFLESGAVQVQPRAQKDEGPTGSKGGEDGGVKIASEKKRGWASLDDGSGLAAAKQMVVDGTGARDKDSLERSPRQSTRIARSEKGSKRLRREAAADAGVSSTANQFAALADHGEGKGRVLSFESKGPDTVLNRAAKEHSHLMSADSVGVARRDLKPRTEGGEAAGRGSVGKELKELKVLRPLMSLNEWQKLSSAKQRKKIRKLAARDAKQETLRTKLMNEANEEDFKMESALKVDVGSGRLAAVPTDQRFHVETAGRGMQISQGGLVVRRGPGVSTPTYVFWGSQLSEGISRWALRIDRKRSSVYIGVADMPLDPDEGFAKYLQSSAWMLSDCGALFETQQGTARNSLRERLIPSPDGGHTVEVNIPSIGTAIYTAKNKYRKHRYAFKDGSLVKMELDRDAHTLRFCVDNKQWISLTGVSRYARPFLNFFTAGDGATLLQAEDGRSIRVDLV